jgi:hypothetical protein
LETFGEIAITIMGFTGLVGALQMRGRRAFVGPGAGVIVTLLLVSALVVFAAFLPGTIQLKVISADETWRTAFDVLLGAHLFTWLLAFPYMRHTGLLLNALPQPDRTIGLVMLFVGISATSTEVLVVSGLIESNLPFLYRGVLLALLLIGMSSFVLVLFALDRDGST